MFQPNSNSNVLGVKKTETKQKQSIFSTVFVLIIFTFFNIHKNFFNIQHWIRENFRHPVFDGFTCFEMSWNTISPFLQNVGLSVYMSPKFCGHCNSRTITRKLMELYIQLHLDIVWCWLDFGAYHSGSSDDVRYFWFL